MIRDKECVFFFSHIWWKAFTPWDLSWLAFNTCKYLCWKKYWIGLIPSPCPPAAASAESGSGHWSEPRRMLRYAPSHQWANCMGMGRGMEGQNKNVYYRSWTNYSNPYRIPPLPPLAQCWHVGEEGWIEWTNQIKTLRTNCPFTYAALKSGGAGVVF